MDSSSSQWHRNTPKWKKITTINRRRGIRYENITTIGLDIAKNVFQAHRKSMESDSIDSCLM
jgi:hypothetical protein